MALDRRKFLQMVGLGSAVALLPYIPASASVQDELYEDWKDWKQEYPPNCVELTINFNDNLMNDHASRYALFYADEFDVNGNPILIAEGEVNGQSEIKIPVETNRQVKCRALGIQTAQYVEAEMFVQDEPTMHMIAAMERNYDNQSS